jgi:hypothetical protein
MRKICAVSCAMMLFFNGFGQDSSLIAKNFPPPTNPPVVMATETKEIMIIDGRLNETVWNQAPVIKEFFRMEPRQGGSYNYPTHVRVVFDKKNLYFGVFCKDSGGLKALRVQDLRRDFLYGENDIFYLQLDPQNLKRYCASFQTTPYGNQRDAQIFDDTFTDNEWDALWKVRTTITDSGYYAEFAIPFASLRYEKQNEDSVGWGLTYARLARKNYEVTVFPAVPQAFSPYRMNYAAQLKGLKLPDPSINLRLQPYTLYQYDKSAGANGQRSSKSTFKAGGEIKWAINPRSVLDITFNTDFAQADVDLAVNNLTRFNVFFPERRQFFLENRGLYAGADFSNIKPFFSRAIGLANAQFNAAPVPIDAGIRYSDRNQKRTWAGLYVHQRGTDFQGAANFAVARYLKNYGKQNNVGIMVTHRADESDNAKGFLERHNTTVSIDGFIRPNDDVTIQYIATASRDNLNDSIGIAGSFYASWSPNKWYWAWWTDFVDDKYVPGMGFVFAQNTIRHNPGGYFIWRPQSTRLKKLIRRWDPGFFVNWYQNTHNLKTQEFSLYLFPVYIITSGNGIIEYALYPYWQSFDFSFDILGKSIAAGKYNTFRQMFRYGTDASKKISLTGQYEFGGYYNGKLQTVSLSTRLSPSPYIAFTFRYDHNTFKNFGIARDNFQTDLYTAGLRLAYNPRIQLSAFYQYNSYDQQGRWNIRGSWEFAPLSFLYVVFNENNFKDTPVRNQSVISKLSYLKQF